MNNITVVFIDSCWDPDLIYGCVVSTKVSKTTLESKIKDIVNKYDDDLVAVEDLEMALPREWECKFYPYNTTTSLSI